MTLDPDIEKHDSYWQELKVGGLYRIRYIGDGPYGNFMDTLAWDSHIVMEGKMLGLKDFHEKIVMVTDLILDRAITTESWGQGAVGAVDVRIFFEEKIAVIKMSYWANWKVILKPVPPL